MSCGILLTRLAQSLDELHLFAASLEEGKDALHAMNAELRLTGAALAQLNDKVLITRAVDATDGQYQPQPIWHGQAEPAGDARAGLPWCLTGDQLC